MTTVRVPVRIRLDLDPARPPAELARLLRDATEQATVRAAERASRVPAVRDAAWDDGPPAVTVRFTGAALPQALAADLSAATRAALQTATARLQAPSAGAAKGPAGTARKVPVAVRLRSFATLGEAWDAVLGHYHGDPPGEVLVIARIGGSPRQAIVVANGGQPTRRIEGDFKLFVPARFGGGERPAGALDADELRFWRFVGDEKKWHAALAELELEKPGVPQFAWPGPAAIYEFRKVGAHVQWHVAPASFTSGTLPVVVLTEEVVREGYGTDCAPLDLSTAGEADLRAPYLGEPHLSEWPADREHLAALIGEIATRLAMPPGGYAGSFAIVAAAEIGRQSERLGVAGGGTRGRQAELRRLAEASVLTTNLAAAYVDAMYSADRSKSLRCPLAGHSGQWAAHFHQLFFRVRRDAVGQLFVSACQDVLLEVLEKSLVELDRRLDATNFPQYMRFTRALLVIVLAPSAELEDLRRRIGVAKARNRNPGLAWRAPNLHAGWGRASADVVAAIRDAAPDSSPAGAVAAVDGQYWAKDAHGRWWSDEQLAFAIGTARDEAFLIDPFLEKIKDLSDVASRLADAQRRDDERSEQAGNAVTEAVDAEFSAVLKEVRRENLERTARVRRDRTIALGLASFVEDRTDEIGARLTGIHRKADERLRPMFGYQAVYVDALHELAAAELGKAELTEFFSLVGLPFLAVFCPPAAFLLGAAQAAGALVTAYEHRGIQRALLGGDEIITRAQAEAELWAAWIGAALAFLPAAKPLARGLSGAARLALPGAERRVAAIAAIRLAKQEAEHLFAVVTAEELVSAFLREAVKGYVLNLVLSSAIERFVDAVVHEDLHGEVSRDELRAIMTAAARAAGAGAP
ncbi:hypothetical protein [Amycolatopsis vancoresmycina]|uniref:hypothetical protein n=1 Tax=Amycolatopsis vancoresmycina TaxID=208444 RepID=UPI000527EBAB|nr:hypothetical protein [Amycolatopsis vancoresmycina]